MNIMAKGSLDVVLRHARELFGTDRSAGLPDGQLLGRFVAHHDEAAFAALVQRHGRLVLGVCRRVLGHEHDAEDVFQATFLILVRHAASVRKRDSLAAWLHGVAYRTAQSARRSAMRRQRHESQAEERPTDSPAAEASLRELQAILDEEVQRLPEKYRAPFVLCCLEGKSRAEAARELGWKEGTVSGRLAEARQRLQQRLTRRGVALSAAMGAVALAEPEVFAAVPARLADTVVQAAAQFAAGQMLAAGLVSGQVAALVNGVSKGMAITKAKLGVAILAALVLAAGAGLGAHQVLSGRQPEGKQANAPEPPTVGRDEPKPEVDKPARTDWHGDPLPPGAVARIGTLRLYNGSQFSGLLYAPDGKTLISSGLHDTVHCWDAATGKELCHLRTGWVNSLALSPDGKRLAAAAYDRPTIQLWDAASGKELMQLPIGD